MNTINEFLIEKIISDGYGLSRKDGKVYFIKNAIPGEIVTIKEPDEKKKFSKSRVESIIKSSPNRIVPACKYYEECGGCDFLHIDSKAHAEIKTIILKELLKKNGKTEYDGEIKFFKNKNNFGYRNKVTLSVKNGNIGLLKKGTNEVIEIDTCLICRDEINKILNKLSKIEFPETGFSKIQIRVSKAGGTLVTFYTDLKDIHPYESIFSSVDADNVIVILKHDKVVLFKGKGEMTDLIGGYLFSYSHSNFMQVNYSAASDLYEFISLYATGGNKMLDLYSGIGIYSVLYSKLFKSVISIEGNASSVYYQRKNLRENMIKNVNAAKKSIDNRTEITNDMKFDMCITDPSREGMAHIFLQSILKNVTDRFIYVSCDPSTLSRDTAIILNDEFEIRDIAVFDMFPQTRHFETVVIFDKKL